MTMNKTRTALFSRTALAASIAALGGSLLLAGCGDANGIAGIGGGSKIYQNSKYADDYVMINGDDITYIDAGDDEELAILLDDVERNSIDIDAGYVDQRGSLNAAQDTVVWEDGDTDEIRVDEDLIQLGGYTYIPVNTDQAQAARDDYRDQISEN